MTTTPETNAEVAHHSATLGLGFCSADFARQLEIQRDEARKKAADILDQQQAKVESLIKERDIAEKELTNYKAVAKRLAERMKSFQRHAFRTENKTWSKYDEEALAEYSRLTKPQAVRL